MFCYVLYALAGLLFLASMTLVLVMAVRVLYVSAGRRRLQRSATPEAAPTELGTAKPTHPWPEIVPVVKDLIPQLDQSQLDPLGDLMEAIAEGNEDKVRAATRALVRALRNSESMLDMFRPLFEHLLQVNLSSAENRQRIQKQLTAAKSSAGK